MKKTSLPLLMIVALCRTATAADLAAPRVSLEPQPAEQPASQVAPASPLGAGLDDFGFAHSSSAPPGPSGPTARDDEYRSAAQTNPALEGF